MTLDEINDLRHNLGIPPISKDLWEKLIEQHTKIPYERLEYNKNGMPRLSITESEFTWENITPEEYLQLYHFAMVSKHKFGIEYKKWKINHIYKEDNYEET